MCVSRGVVVFGLAGLALRLDCDGGVDPDENFELKLDIQEFRRPIGFGSDFREAEDGVDGFDSSGFSVGFSTGVCLGSTGAGSSLGTCFGSGVAAGGVGLAGLLLERDLRCDLDLEAGGSLSERDLSPDDTDLVRDK